MKKFLKSLAIAFAGVVVLAGCAGGKSAQDTFVDAMVPDLEASSAGKIEITLDELKLADTGQVDANMNFVVSQLKGIKFSGDYATEPKKNNKVYGKFNVEVLGQSLPIEIIANDKEYYMSSDFITTIVQLQASMTGSTGGIDTAKLAQLQGKYIDILALSKTTGAGSSLSATDQKKLAEMQKKLQKEYKTYLEGLSKDAFKKDGDNITHTFDKKEFKELCEKFLKFAEKEKLFPEGTSATSDMLKDFNTEFDKAIKTLDMKVTVNTKTNAKTCEITFAPTDTTVLTNFKITMKDTPSKDVKMPDMPSKDKVISEKEMNSIMSSSATSYE